MSMTEHYSSPPPLDDIDIEQGVGAQATSILPKVITKLSWLKNNYSGFLSAAAVFAFFRMKIYLTTQLQLIWQQKIDIKKAPTTKIHTETPPTPQLVESNDQHTYIELIFYNTQVVGNDPTSYHGHMMFLSLSYKTCPSRHTHTWHTILY